MKIFGIGLRKTGLTSLKSALSYLGYNVVQAASIMRFSEDSLRLYLNGHDIKDGLIDDPVPLFYKELDKLYPRSKFILTTRPLESWMNSAENHFSSLRGVLRWLLNGNDFAYIKAKYGKNSFDYHLYRQAFIKHEQEVLDYFRNRPDDLLVHFPDSGWENLCSFLDSAVPKEDYPHENKRSALRNRVLSVF